jgi:TolB-like protein
MIPGGNMVSARKLALAAMVLAATAILSQVASAQEADRRPTVAVLYFTNAVVGPDHSQYESLGKGVADMLVNSLAGNAGIRVVEREHLQQILEELNLSRSDNISPEQAVQVGKLLNAHHMIMGSFIADPRGTMVMNMRTVDVATSAVTYTDNARGQKDNFFDIIDELSGKINRGLKLPMIPVAAPRRGDAGAAAAATPATSRPAPRERLDFQTALLYSRALDSEDKGDKEQAIELFKATLEKFPEYEPAKRNLARLQTGLE